MNIHLIGSMREFDTDLRFMNKIAQIVTEEGGSIVLDWFTGVQDRKTRGTTAEEALDWPTIVESNVSAVNYADALIVEGSRFNYSQGYQTAVALQQNKPVLNLYRNDLPEYRDWPDKFFVSGIVHPLFTSKTYKDEKDLERVVTEFLHTHAKKTQELDIKIVLEDDIYRKVEEISKESDKSKASVIKDIISKTIRDQRMS